MIATCQRYSNWRNLRGNLRCLSLRRSMSFISAKTLSLYFQLLFLLVLRDTPLCIEIKKREVTWNFVILAKNQKSAFDTILSFILSCFEEGWVILQRTLKSLQTLCIFRRNGFSCLGLFNPRDFLRWTAQFNPLAAQQVYLRCWPISFAICSLDQLRCYLHFFAYGSSRFVTSLSFLLFTSPSKNLPPFHCFPPETK